MNSPLATELLLPENKHTLVDKSMAMHHLSPKRWIFPVQSLYDLAEWVARVWGTSNIQESEDPAERAFFRKIAKYLAKTEKNNSYQAINPRYASKALQIRADLPPRLPEEIALNRIREIIVGDIIRGFCRNAYGKEASVKYSSEYDDVQNQADYIVSKVEGLPKNVPIRIDLKVSSYTFDSKEIFTSLQYRKYHERLLRIKSNSMEYTEAFNILPVPFELIPAVFLNLSQKIVDDFILHFFEQPNQHNTYRAYRDYAAREFDVDSTVSKCSNRVGQILLHFGENIDDSALEHANACSRFAIKLGNLFAGNM